MHNQLEAPMMEMATMVGGLVQVLQVGAFALLVYGAHLVVAWGQR